MNAVTDFFNKLFNSSNYIWFIVAGLVLIITVIGFFADRANQKNKKEVVSDPIAKVETPIAAPSVVPTKDEDIELLSHDSANLSFEEAPNSVNNNNNPLQ